MGLLNSNTLNEWATGIPGRAKEMLAGLLSAPGEVKQLFDPKFQKGLLDQRSVTDKLDKQKALATALEATGMAPIGLAGTFIGKGAKTWNAAANEKALQMAKESVDPRVIWKETGNWKGPDGFWRQEIPDNTASWVDDVGNNVAGHIQKNQGQPLQNAFQHKQIYEAYPYTKNIKLFQQTTGNGGGQFVPGANELTINTMTDFASPSSRVGATAIHELQHAIQEREGWAKGGSPEQMAQEYESLRDLAKKRIDRLKAAKSGFNVGDSPEFLEPIVKQTINRMNELQDPADAYRRLAGEAESRATQARMNMDMAQRLNMFPEDSYDVPINQLIIRGLLGK